MKSAWGQEQVMPFYTNQPRSNLLPIFVFPGVLGNKSELKNLANNLSQISQGKYKIYVYEDPRLLQKKDTNLFNPDFTFIDVAKFIIQEMSLESFERFPRFVGHSFGCIMVNQVAQLLQLAGYHPRLFLIDSLSLTASNEYFNNNPISSTRDFIAILNYAAQLSLLKPIVLEKNKIETLTKYNFDNRFDQIAKSLIYIQTFLNEEDLGQFKKYFDVAKQNLKNIYRTNEILVSLDKINLFLTHETTAKHSSQFGGWENYAREINLIKDETLENQSHMSLLTDINFNAAKLAELIINTFNQELTEEEKFYREVVFNLTQYQNNPSAERLQSAVESSEQNSNISPLSDASMDDVTEATNDITEPIKNPNHLNDNKNKKVSKGKQQFGLFNSAQSDQQSTRDKRRERAKRLQSP
jgi:thioesterase domain-containing protein